jgi:hypothetical protein
MMNSNISKRLFTAFLLSISALAAEAQNDGTLITGFSEHAATRDASAVLEANSDDQGMLAPRLTMAQRNAIVSPATSLLIYQTDNTPGYYYNTGTPGAPVWDRLTVASGVLTGSGAATRVAFWSGASALSSNANLYWDNTNSRLGINTASPLAGLQVRNAKAYVNKSNVDPSAAYANADLVLGDNTTGRSGFTGGTGSHIFLQSLDKSAITALDESNDLGQISYQNLVWTIGENVGWGAQGVRLPVLGTGYVKSNAIGNLSSGAILAADVPTLNQNTTGNAATATNVSYAGVTNIPTRTDWASPNPHRGFVAEQLSWKNYANGHTIFDASASTSPGGTAVSNTTAQIPWAATYPTLMGWNGVNTYGVRVDVARYAESAPGDNLGNHTATAALNMVGNAINNAQELNSTGDHLEFMRNRTDDNSYEWLGYYSGATRQGIILYDGAWTGANNVTNEFSITSENNNLLTLNTSGNAHIALMPKGTGNVGIGTLAPASKLEVVSDALTLSGANLDMNRDGFSRSGISWYSKAYPGWSDYMADAGQTGVGPHGDLTAPAGGYVNRWAMRSYIENVAGYGWTFESAANPSTTPAVKFEIRASDGLFHGYGDGYVDGVMYAGAHARMGTNIAAGYYQDATNGAYRAIVGAGTTTGYYFQTNAGGVTTMYVGLGGTYNGRVGIGTTTPNSALQLQGDNFSTFGPNSTWGATLRVGGNGNVDNNASVAATNGNLHIDAASGAFATYLNYYRGTSGIVFGNGASGSIGSIDNSGYLSMNNAINSGVGYRVGGAAATGSYLRGNGTNFVSATIQPSDIPYGNSSTGGPRAQGNFGQFQPHGTYTDFNTGPAYWGWNYVQGTGNAPNATSSQWYREVVSLGDAYPARGAGGYSLELAFPRFSQSAAGVWMRTVENGTIGGWTRIDGGNGIPNNGSGDWQIASNSGATDYTTSSLELRETNFGGAGQQPPRLGFHWGGVVASQISIESDGKLSFRNNPGTGYENIIANRHFATNTSNSYERTTVANGIWASESLNNASVHIFNSESEQGGFFANGDYNGIYSPGDNDLVKFMDEDWFDNSGTIYDASSVKARIDGSGNFYTVSDRNFKEDIAPVTDAVSKIDRIGGYTYSFKRNTAEIEKNSPIVRGAGVIAQELKEVLPEAVSDQDGHLMVNYSAMSALFIEAIKEQQAQILILKQQNAAMQVRLANLESLK